MSANRFVVLLTALLLVILATGCGKKGQLYLPDPSRPAATPDGKDAPTPAAVPEETEPSLPSAPAAP